MTSEQLILFNEHSKIPDTNSTLIQSLQTEDMNRFQFLRYIILLALEQHERNPKQNKLEVIDGFLEKIIADHEDLAIDGKKFREEHMYNDKVNSILEKN